MLIDDVVTELLLRWEENPSLTPEELCREHKDSPEYPELLEAVKEGIRNLQAAAPFVDTAKEGESSLRATPEGRSGDQGSVPDPEMPPGYDRQRELGRGAMGVVYLAWQHSLKRQVALKMILDGAYSSPQQLSRFRNEAQAVARLKHPNIVQIHEIGEHKRLPYFSLEFVEGGSLAEMLRGQPLLPADAARLTETLARAMHHAHERGIVHRDLKPGNVLLTRDDTPKIADFGLAKQLEGETGQTREGAVMGTPSYMAPEQAEGKTKEISPRTDVYALGAILYTLLTGRPPFQGATTTEILEQVKSKEPVPPRKLQPKMPRDLETICLKCLQKEPAKRYASANELADDVRRFLNGETILARPTPVWERAVKWARRRPTPASLMGVAVLLLLVVATASLWYWDRYLRIRVEYFAGATKRWGAFEGVTPVTEQEARHRTYTYKFYRRGRGGPVEKAEVVNGHGELDPRYGASTMIDGLTALQNVTTKRDCRHEYKRDQQGRVIEEVAFDPNGEIVWILHYKSKEGLAEYTDQGGFPCAHAPSGASHVQVIRDEQGHEKEVKFLNERGNPRPNRDGVFGMRVEYNERGLPVRTTFFDVRGRPTLNKYHFAGFTAEYNDRGLPTEIRFFGRHNEPVFHKDGYAGAKLVYDNYGNTSALTHVGLDDRPTLHKDGYAKATYQHDDHGNIIHVRFFDTDDKPALHEAGYAEIARQYDDRGRLIEESSFGLDGKLALTKLGPAMTRVEYDERGNVKRRRFFDADGKPTLIKDGYAESTQQHDERCRITEVALFGLDGEPTLHKNSYAKIARKYDDRGNMTEETAFGPDGQPTLVKGGCAQTAITYDDRNNKIEQAFFDEKGNPALHKDGNWKVTLKYDDNGNQTEKIYVGLDGRPTFVKGGYSRITWKHDALGNKTEEVYFDTNGRPALVKNGFAKVKMEYDDRGNKKEQAYFDVKGERALHKEGYWKKTWNYDDSGHKTEEASFGLDDRPALVNGVAKTKWKYDAQGNMIEIANFGLKDEPVRFKGGHWKIVWKYDTRGNKTEESYLAPDGNPMLVNRIAKIKMKYDGQGNKVELALFDLDGNPVRHPTDGHWKVVSTYDNRGNRIEETYLAPDGKPMISHGVAKVKMKYDTQGNKIEVANFGLKDEPVRYKGQYWKKVWKFDTRGNQTEEAYLDPDGKPMLVNGVAKTKWKYDALGNTIESANYGLKDEPVLDKEGHWKVVSIYDARGNRIEETYIDPDGKPMLVNGVARKKLKYDNQGNKTEVANFGLRDEPVRFQERHWKIVLKYDARGNQSEVTYLDPDGKPTLCEDGYATVKWTYDDGNEVNGVSCFDAHGNQLKTQVYVTKVSPNSPAKMIGLLENDILVNYGGQEIRTTYMFMGIKRSEGPRHARKDLTVLRDGELRIIRSTPPGRLGIEMEDKVVHEKKAQTGNSAKKP